MPAVKPLLAGDGLARVELLSTHRHAPRPRVSEPVFLFPPHRAAEQRRVSVLPGVKHGPEVAHRFLVVGEVCLRQVSERVARLAIDHEGDDILERRSPVRGRNAWKL
jgi:hypothetical protein